MRKALWLAAVLALGATATCADLEPLDEGVCGNGIVEMGEDCDTVAESPADPEEKRECFQPGEEHGCRYRCSPVGEPGEAKCPDGWGCGVDEVCRAATGQFEPGPVYEHVRGVHLQVANFDGDLLPDLLSYSIERTQILFGDVAGQLEQGPTVPALLIPAVGKLTDGEQRDLVLLNEGWLSVLRGQADRTFAPTFYAPFSFAESDSRALLLDAMPEQLIEGAYKYSGDELLMYAQGELLHGDANTEGEDPMAEGLDPNTFIGPPTIGDVVDPWPALACEELVFGIEGTNAIYVYSPCHWSEEDGAGMSTPVNNPDMPPPVTVPHPLEVQRGVILAHVNADSYIDMLIGAGSPPSAVHIADCGDGGFGGAQPGGGGPGGGSAGAGGGLGGGGGAGGAGDGAGGTGGGAGGAGGTGFGGEPPTQPWLAVAYGTAGGTFVGSADNVASVIRNWRLYGPEAGQHVGAPIAAGHFNDDGVIDFVTTFGVLVSDGGTSEEPLDCIPYRQTVHALDGWEYAYVGHFNGNDKLDIVVANSWSSQITFLNGAGEGVFNEFTIPLNGPPDSFAVGDFDGDLLQDIAYAERDLFSNEWNFVPDASLAISFGSAFGPPTDPVRMGRVAGLDQIVAGRLSSVHFDGVDDLVVVTRSGDPAFPEDGIESKVAIILGSGERLLTAPFLFRRNQPEHPDEPPDVPVATVVGQFDDEPGHADLAALTVSLAPYDRNLTGSNDRSLVWLLPSQGDAELERNYQSATMQFRVEIENLFGPLEGRLFPETVMLAALDLGDDGRDEVVALTLYYPPDPNGPPDALAMIPKGAILVLSSDGTKFSIAQAELTDEIYGYSYGNVDSGSGTNDDGSADTYYDGTLAVRDVTGDGRRDIVALSAAPSLEAGPEMFVASVVVFENLDDGSLSIGDRQVLPNPPHPYWSTPENPIPLELTDFALLNVDTDPALEIVLLTFEGLYAADIDWPNRQYTNVRPLQIGDEPPMMEEFTGDDPPPPGSSMVSGLRVVGADFNGDGVDDLVVGDVMRTLVFWGRPVNP